MINIRNPKTFNKYNNNNKPSFKRVQTFKTHVIYHNIYFSSSLTQDSSWYI